MLTIIIRSIIARSEDEGKFYPQVYLYKCQNTRELMLIKQMHHKNVMFVTIGVLKILILSMNHIFAMAIMIYAKSYEF